MSCSLLIYVAGVIPATDFLKESGLPMTGRGEVVVDQVCLSLQNSLTQNIILISTQFVSSCLLCLCTHSHNCRVRFQILFSVCVIISRVVPESQ